MRRITRVTLVGAGTSSLRRIVRRIARVTLVGAGASPDDGVSRGGGVSPIRGAGRRAGGRVVWRRLPMALAALALLWSGACSPASCERARTPESPLLAGESAPGDAGPAADAGPAETDARAARAAALRDEATVRMALMQRLLLEDNRTFLEREPELVAGKFRKMAHSPFLFLRGTAPLFWHDVTTPESPGHLPSPFGQGPAGRVLITGDAHPENFGSYLSGEGILLLDFNDFDTAGHGPWHLELRRLALGWYVAGRMLEARTPAEEGLATTLADAAVEGYIAEIIGQGQGAAPIRVREGGSTGVVIADLLRRARRDGDIREELDDFTRIDDEGRRTMFIGTHREGEREGVFGSELVAVSADEEARMREVVSRWRHTLHADPGWPEEGYRVLGVSRRLGAGVGSYPILRYYVLVQGPDEDIASHRLLDVKEAVPGVRLPNVAGSHGDPPPPGRDADEPDANADEGAAIHRTLRSSDDHASGSMDRWSDAERVVRLMRAFQEFEDNDPLAGWADLGTMSFHVQDRVKYQKNLDVERMIDRRQRTRGNRFGDEDLREVARVTGAVLARGHARAPVPGDPQEAGLGPILAELAGHENALRTEVRAFIALYGPLFHRDFAAFRRLLEEAGPLLGHE